MAEQFNRPFAVVCNYNREYTAFRHRLHPKHHSKFVKVKRLEDIRGQEFSDYIEVGAPDTSRVRHELIKQLISRIR